MLLFERLSNPAGHEPGKPVPFRVADREELRRSVQREVGRLLNTRCVRTERNGTVIDYGVPDFSWMSASSPDDRRALADTIARKIAAFEPRLQSVQVTIDSDPSDPRAVIGVIQATLRVESVCEPVSFPLAIREKGGEVVVDLEPCAGYGY